MNSLAKKEAKLGWLMLSPALSVLLIMILYPLAYNIYLSFFNVSLDGSKTWLGLNNYTQLLKSSEYYKSWLTTIIYLIGTVGGVTILGLLVALLLNQKFKGRNIVRTIMLVPYVAPVASVMFGWQFFFDDRGIVSWAIVELGLSDTPVNIIGNPAYALWIVIVFDIWKHFPLTALLLLSRLQSIPKDQYEAAAMDGYGAWGRFWNVTLPECWFVLGTVVILRLIWNFNRFEDVYLIAEDRVKTLPVYTYLEVMTGVPKLGLAAAISVLSLIVLMVFISVYVKKVLKW